MKRLSFIPTLIILLSVASCKHDGDLTGVPEISFSTDIQRIVSGNCSYSGCHGNGQHSLRTYEDVMQFGDVKPGDAHGSRLYKSITGKGEEKMPPSGYNQLSYEDIIRVYVWIQQGAKNN